MTSAEALALLQSKYGTSKWTNWKPHGGPIYDYVRYPDAGTTQLSFFNIPVGGVDPNGGTKSLEHTNLNQPSTLGSYAFFAFQLRTHIRIAPKSRQPAGIASDANNLYAEYSAAMSKLLELYRRGILNISFAQASFFSIEKPFSVCPPGFGVRVTQLGGIIGPTLWVIPQNDVWDCYDLNPPQFIEPTQQFTVTVDFADGTSPVFTGLVNSADLVIEIGMYFEGYKFRPES